MTQRHQLWPPPQLGGEKLVETTRVLGKGKKSVHPQQINIFLAKNTRVRKLLGK